jgi:hypothetical protein
MAILPIVVPVPVGLVRNGESEDFLSAHQHRIHLLAGAKALTRLHLSFIRSRISPHFPQNEAQRQPNSKDKIVAEHYSAFYTALCTMK